MSEIRREPAPGSAGGSSEQIQGHPTERETLQNQLMDLLFHPAGGEPDLQALDALVDRLEEIDPMPGGVTAEESLEQFRRRYAPVFEAENAASAGEPPLRPGKRFFQRPFAKALPVACALVLLFGTATAQAFGLDVFSAIARWTSEIFRLDNRAAPYAAVTVRPLEVGEEAVYGTLEEAVAAFGIDAPIVPREIPEGFELVEVKAAQKELGLLIYADYESENSYFQIRYRETDNQQFNSLEKEFGEADVYFINEVKHYLFSDFDRKKAAWQNGELECKISGYISEQEIKTMINSIYEE